MAEWKKIKISRFLKEREGRYAPNDEAVQVLKRLNKIDFAGEIHLSDKGSKTGMIIVEPGDLVISGINVSKGALAVYHGKEPIAATIHYSSYIFDESRINIDYFKRFVKSQSFVQALKDQVKGGIKTEIKPKHFLPLEIHLPDIDSQKEIVSFFNKIENEMNDLSGEIERQESFIKQLCQQVLKEAIEGKLTAKWREQHPDLISGDNHALKLLEKIKAEKERLIKEGNPSTSLRARTKKDKPLTPITDEEKPFDLPDGWVWCRLPQILELGNSLRRGPFGSSITKLMFIPKSKDATKVYEQKNAIYKDCSLGTYFINLTEHPNLQGFLAGPGDLIISCAGTIGETYLLPPDAPRGVINQALLRLRLDKRVIKNEFFRIVFRTLTKLRINEDAKGTAMKNISSVNYLKNKLLFPLPSISEQKIVLQIVDTLMAMIDELEKQVTERKGQSEKLMQSVLREAMSAGQQISR